MGGGGERLTGRNPNITLCLLCSDVGISYCEKQLPDTDQSIRYFSYFSKRKREKEERKTVSFLFFFPAKYIYI